jgi:hypothetical protein
VQPADIRTASATFTTMRQFGGAFGVAVSGTGGSAITPSCSVAPSITRDDNRENTIPVRSPMSHPVEPGPLYLDSYTRWQINRLCRLMADK